MFRGLGWFPSLLAALNIYVFPRDKGIHCKKLKLLNTCVGLSGVIVGLGLYSYYVRELLASLALFTGAFFLLGLAAAGVFALCYAGVQAVIWTRPASRNMIALSRRLVAAYVTLNAEQLADCALVNRRMCSCHAQNKCVKENANALDNFCNVVIVLWLFGLVTSYTLGGFIHILLVLAMD